MICTHDVAGSIPVVGSSDAIVAQLAEQDFRKVEVGGSSPLVGSSNRNVAQTVRAIG